MGLSASGSLRVPGHAKRRRPRLRIGAALLAAIATVLIGTQSAGAVQAPPGPHADGLAGPLAIDLVHGGRTALVAQSDSGTASLVGSDGKVRDVFSEPGLDGIAAGPFGVVVYSVRDGDETGFTSSLLKVRFPWGATRTLADLGAYETAHNPDSVNTYGVQGLSDECAAQWPTDEIGPPSYPGQVDSNPYKLAVTIFGVYVADAGANAIWFVDWAGHIRTVGVLPPQPLVIPDDPSSTGVPECAAGKVYNFEPVPTDVEVTPRGMFVSLLPGGPEGPELGARGSVVRLNPWTGRSNVVATGFAGATDLAVSPRGDIYVAELFGNNVSKVTRHGTETVAELPMPAAVAWGAGRLVVAYNVFDVGKLATING